MTPSKERIEKALEDLGRGRFCLIFDDDDREGETDLVTASQEVDFESIRRLRQDAGGLICSTIPYDFHTKVGLPFLTDIYSHCSERYDVLKALEADDIPYDARSSFTLTVNHRETFTGVTDKDRALTIREMAHVISDSQQKGKEEIQKELGDKFRTPGHVSLLNTSKDLLSTREGHTELSTAMVVMAGLVPSATICEMMGEGGMALAKEGAVKYAEENDFAFLTGDEVKKAWFSWREEREL